MKKTTVFAVLMLLLVSMIQVETSAAFTDEDDAIAALNQKAETYVEAGKWEAFSHNLEVSLQSEYDGVKSAALGMIIRYGNQLDMENAVFDVVGIYRNHENEQMQRMALVALGQMENDWAIEFLERAHRFEDSQVLRQTIRAVITDYREKHSG